MQKRLLTKYLCLTIVILAVIFSSTPAVLQATANGMDNQNDTTVTLKVAFPSVAGISETDENGKRKGILVDYLNEISKYTNWQYEYVDVSAEQMTDDFIEGKFDLMGGTYYNAEWERYFGYPRYTMGNSHATLIFNKDDPDIKSYDLSSINGKTIGVYDNATEKIRRLNVFLEANGLDCKLKQYTRDEMIEAGGTLYKYLREGEVDVLIGNDTDVHEEFALFTVFEDQPYYIVAQPDDQEILARLNYALEKILEINPNFAEDIYNKNVTDVTTSYVRLSESELAFVKEKGTAKVAIVRDWHPFFCMEDGTVNHEGLVPEIMGKVTEFSGLKFEYVYVDNYSEMIKAVLEGRADIVGCFDSDDEDAFDMGIARTEPYAHLNNTIVKNKTVNFPGEGLVGGVVRGRTLEPGLTDKEPVYFATAKEGLEAVNRGTIDFFSGLSAVIEHEFQMGGFPNLTFVSSANSTLEISFALDRPVDTKLYSVINKSLRSITDDEKTNITNKNIVSEGVAHSPSLADIIAENPVSFVLIICAAFALLAGGVIVFVRFRYRAKVMQTELEKAEARSRAKSDFLSRMSHEIRTPMNAIVGLTDLVSAEPELPAGAREKINKIRSSSDYMLSLINDILDMSRIENDKLTLEPESFSLRGMLDEIDKMTEVLVGRKGVICKATRGIVHDAVKTDPLRLRQVLVNLISNAVKFTHRGKKIYLSATETSSDADSATFEFSVADEGVGIAPEDKERIFNAFEQAGTNISKSDGTGLGLAISSSIVRLMGGELRVESELGKGSRFSFVLKIPLGEEQITQHISVSENCLAGVRVLLAEDNDINAEIASELLAMYGASTDRAVNGQAAVDMFTASEKGRYDVILMDLKMPVKDGLEATREIRASVHPEAADIPVIAMTANSFVEDRRAAEDAGMNGFVPKPVNMELLVTTVRDLTEKRKSGA